MSQSASITLENNRLMVSGDLTLFTVASLYSKSLELLAKVNELNFDFANVASSNSAGVALLVEWISYAKQNNKAIHFANIPPQLSSIATACGVEKFLA